MKQILKTSFQVALTTGLLSWTAPSFAVSSAECAKYTPPFTSIEHADACAKACQDVDQKKFNRAIAYLQMKAGRKPSKAPKPGAVKPGSNIPEAPPAPLPSSLMPQQQTKSSSSSAQDQRLAALEAEMKALRAMIANMSGSHGMSEAQIKKEVAKVKKDIQQGTSNGSNERGKMMAELKEVLAKRKSGGTASGASSPTPPAKGASNPPMTNR